MKDTIRLTLLTLCVAGVMAAAMLTSARTRQLPATLTPEEISWVEFCRANGYDPYTSDDDILDEFLDTWRGSVPEEEALTRHGIAV